MPSCLNVFLYIWSVSGSADSQLSSHANFRLQALCLVLVTIWIKIEKMKPSSRHFDLRESLGGVGSHGVGAFLGGCPSLPSECLSAAMASFDGKHHCMTSFLVHTHHIFQEVDPSC